MTGEKMEHIRRISVWIGLIMNGVTLTEHSGEQLAYMLSPSESQDSEVS